MEETDVKHIHILEFPKQLFWTERDLEYFLEEMPGEAGRMNNDVYDILIKEVKSGQDYSLEEAFNLAYYECVRISWARYPESKDIFDVLEMDIQHNQIHVDYGFTNLIMNMVWAMLYSTGTAKRFTEKLHSYLVNSKRLKFWFREFFTPNDQIHTIYPYEEKEEPRYNYKFTPCPANLNYNSSDGGWGRLTIGYKEHLIEELLLLWPADKREYIRKSIMDEKATQLKNFEGFAKKHIVEIIDEPETHLHINLEEGIVHQGEEGADPLSQQIAELRAEVDALSKENADLKEKLKSLNLPQIVLTNNSNFARVVQAMVSARYFKRADGDETNATEVGNMLLRLFGVSNTWKSVLQKAYSRENPLKTFDELRTAAENYWANRFGLTKEIRKKGKK